VGKRGGLPKIVGGPRSWRDDIDDALLDDEPELAEPDRINAYICDTCGQATVTRDVHKGVTPMFLACRASGDVGSCKGQGSSCMYDLRMYAIRTGHPWWGKALEQQRWPEPQWEWFMPTLRERRRIERRDPALGEHLRRGGLHLRRVEA
jgi:hypothetical protein